MSEHVKTSFATMCLNVSIGWCIYPLGYFLGYLMGGVNADSPNLVYNLADVINKITMVMLAAGYCNEAGLWKAVMGFIVGMAGFILFETSAGDAGTAAAPAIR